MKPQTTGPSRTSWAGAPAGAATSSSTSLTHRPLVSSAARALLCNGDRRAAEQHSTSIGVRPWLPGGSWSQGVDVDADRPTPRGSPHAAGHPDRNPYVAHAGATFATKPP